MISTKYALRSAHADDEPALVELFNRIFCPPSPEAERMTRALWSWRYRGRNAPDLGARSCVAIDQNEGGIAGHVGGLPLPLWVDGDDRMAVHSVDNMIADRSRAGLRRVGVFTQMVQHWIDLWMGRGRDFLAFGFPTEEAFRIGQRFLGYSLLRTVNLLVCEDPWRLDQGDRATAVHDPYVRGLLATTIPAEADKLWKRVRKDLGISVARTAEYLSWRYDHHPGITYVPIEARDMRTGELRGLCVLRTRAWARDDVTLMDWICPRDDDAATLALLQAASSVARSSRSAVMVTWFPESSPWFERFQRLGFLVRSSPLLFAARSWEHEVSVHDLRSTFYATLGDVDWL